MTKEEKIKEAWNEIGIELNTLETKPDENGFIRLSHSIPSQEKIILSGIKSLVIGKNIAHGIAMYRPKSLQGIENNNDWIKIESEADLPKQDNDLWLMFEDGSVVLGKWCIFTYQFKTTYDFKFDDDGKFTHYQPMQKPKPPIY